MAAPLEGVRACVFDAYGTLFDLSSAVARERRRLGGGTRADELSRIWRTKQLEYTWLRSLMGHHADFWRVTGDALDYALDTLGIADRDLREALMRAYLRLGAYPEVPGVLRRLRDAGLPCAVLSNGSPAMLEAGVRSAGLEDLLVAVLSVESVGVFKPHPSVYRLALDRLGVARADAIAFQSSNAWDVHGAAAFGFRCAWVNRGGAKPERLPGAAAVELRDLGDLPGALGLA
jgi:2-haloacid dehalogenase